MSSRQFRTALPYALQRCDQEAVENGVLVVAAAKRNLNTIRFYKPAFMISIM